MSEELPIVRVFLFTGRYLSTLYLESQSSSENHILFVTMSSCMDIVYLHNRQFNGRKKERKKKERNEKEFRFKQIAGHWPHLSPPHFLQL